MNSVINYEISGFTYYHDFEDLPDKSKLQTHTHDTLELYYFISGNAVFYVEGNAYKLSPGDILIIREGETHFLKLISDEPYERIVLNFSKSFLSLVDSEQSLMDIYSDRPLVKNNLIKSKDLSIDILSVLTKMESPESSDYHRAIKLKILLSYILLDMNDYYRRITPLENQSAEPDLFSKIILYINQNLSSDLCLDFISSKFYISKSYLNRLFKDKTGCTVWQYITVKRLVLSKGLIEDGTKASKACFLAGFNDYSTFFRQYKKYFGASPKDKI